IFLVTLFFSFIGNAQEINFTEEEKDWMEQHPIVDFGYEPNWEPYEIYENGQFGGIVGDYIKIIEEKTGIKMKPIPNLTWDETMKGLISGTIKVAPSCAVTPKRLKNFEFTEPYIKDPIVIVADQKSSYIGDISDLKGKTVALSKNYYTIELIESQFPDINIIQKENIEACLESVSLGEVDAFVGNLHVITYYMNHKGFIHLKIVAPTPFKTNGIALVVNPEWSTFRDIVQKVFNNISPSQRHEIRKKWIANEYNTSFFSQRFIIWAIIIGVSILVCFGLLYYWNKVLRGLLKRKKITEQQLKESLIALKKQDAEKKVLLQEIHHRVKNNLQVVSSMIRLQANVNQDPNAAKTLNEAVDRVKTIALIHDKIYKSPDINVVELKEYITSLYKDIQIQFNIPKKVDFKIVSDDIKVSVDTIVPLALILNELITNSFKYAFEDQDNPEIKIEFTVVDNRELEMKYFDNGKWLENDKSDFFGTSLIEIFTDQLEGDFKLHKADTGTQYNFIFNTIKLEVSSDKIK
ncbi:MAG: transporter substrate-binding domain-containing protein, partial [Brumimicrobium sp.]